MTTLDDLRARRPGNRARIDEIKAAIYTEGFFEPFGSFPDVEIEPEELPEITSREIEPVEAPLR